MGSMSTEGVMPECVDPGHGHSELFLKLPSKWCIQKGVLTYSLGNRERKQMDNYKLAAYKHGYSMK